MTVEDALVAKLKSLGAISALVGTKIFPDTAPQGTATPYLVYEQTSRSDKACLSGERSGIVMDDFQFFAEGLERSDCAAIRDAVTAAVDGTLARGTWGGVGGIAVRGCTIGTASSSNENPPEASQDFRRKSMLDLTIIWKRG